MVVTTGLAKLRADHFRVLAGQRVGLFTNPSAVDTDLTSAYTLFARADEVNLVALFGPEHGFGGNVQDAIKIKTTIDPRTGLPVFSLYGETLAPTPEMLDQIDVLVCDIQDIGVRYYTYAWTLSHILEAAGEHGTPVMVLDRPNPLGGDVMDGPLLDRAVSSFVGRFPVPVRHGLTLGELAALVNATWNPTPAGLTVIPCEGWRRTMRWPETGLPWVPPSPNMPQLTTLDHYPGACLVEGTILSEGRGTPLPFEIVGAPWIDAYDLVERLNEAGWAQPVGARFRPITFEPFFEKWAGELCGGVQVHIVDRARWRPIEVWLGVIVTIWQMYPDQFAWLPPHAETQSQHFDRLVGGRWIRRQLEADINAGLPVQAILARLAAEWTDERHAFELQRAPFLRYE